MSRRHFTNVNVETEVDIQDVLDGMTDTELAELREEIDERLCGEKIIHINLLEDGIDFDIKVETVTDATKLEILGQMYNDYSANALYTILNLANSIKYKNN